MCSTIQNLPNSHTAFFHSQNLGAPHDNYNLNDAFAESGQVGGGGVNSTDFNNSMHLKGIPDYKSYEGCGMQSQSNLEASSPPTPFFMTGGNYSYSGATTGSEGGGAPYLSYSGGENLYDFRGGHAPLQVMQRNQCGGGNGTRKRICHRLSKVKKHQQVRFFWSIVCPELNKLYRRHVKSKEVSHSKDVLKFVKHCTKALCHAVSATKTKKLKRKKISSMKKELYTCKCILRKLGIKRHSLESIKKKLLSGIKSCATVKKIHQRKSRRFRRRRSGRRRSRRSSHRAQRKGKRRRAKTARRRRRKGRRKTKRGGGYSQYGSNVANTPSYSTPFGGNSTTATPTTYKVTNNCRDNYNHYKQN